ncbi:Tex family protein [Alistipes senegalensis]|uniref:RNA-binding transcriptional accessory protein n=1 Tax=Alistipes senegalensis JC50 TaxID=1033732 RepID=A0ABY5VCD9_9BACT|nr:Tex family protein [Alistipes senegalensis]UEA85946.1 RNA-binding transcriptional accessory protein [Alistipes senegalensis]UWN66469.1 RNA-binding transcriptional accessory protein [Alistipes senegalensis JC50]
MIEQIISRRLRIALPQVQGTVRLLRDGATIPFISRYRKEATGSLNEVQVGAVKEQLERLTELESRRQTILTTIEEQGKLTPELRRRIEECWDPVELEDLYLPYKPKRRTRATVARERGLEPLADLVMAQRARDTAQQARRYVSAEVPTPEDALAGACDIIAERISENEQARNGLRRTFAREGIVHTKVVKGKEAEGAKYSDYFDAATPLRSISSHRFLAMRRGADEGVLKITIDIDADRCIEGLCRQFIRPGSATRTWMEAAAVDSFKRLIRPSIETEQLAAAKEKADDEAIRVFAENLRQLLLSPPLGQKRVIALDPGFRTGCKVVVLDSQGGLLHNTTVYPHAPQNRYAEAAETLKTLAAKYKTEAFAVGDGTAGRETEQLVRGLGLAGVEIFMVSEDGASVYSASAAAREEFPDHDVTVRGAVSIGRRLIDPLSELVKIDPKSIGVGQYQHSVDQGKLKSRLVTVVESCVNRVGVNINTASKHILTYISGLGPALAENIVAYRAANGDFKSRRELLKVPRLGARAFEQAAGFLRVVGGTNPLDNSAVHPESYHIAGRMAADAGVTVEQLLADKALRKSIRPERYVDGDVGLPTVTDILEALDKQGLDPREQLQVFAFDPNVHTIDDLRPGMQLPGIVTNITAFGAFVDIGVKQDGLVHISQLADRYVASPADVVHLGQHVEVRVTGIDTVRNRISLTMRRDG